MELRLEETRSLASWVGSQELLLNRIYELDEVVANIDAVTHDDLMHVASTAFVRPKVNLALIGPFDDTTRFANLIRG
jgi:predicted Zn-dependent peptidase